jgi:predicted dehydrogenase
VKGIGVGCGARSGVSEGAAVCLPAVAHSAQVGLPDAGVGFVELRQRGSACRSQAALRDLQGHTSPGRAQGSKEMAGSVGVFEFDLRKGAWRGDVAFPCAAMSKADRFRTAVVGSQGWLDLAGYKFAEFASHESAQLERLYSEAEFDITDSSSPERLRAYAAMVQELVDTIREDREPTVGGADGRSAVALCVAAAASARSGRREAADSADAR